MDDRAARQRVAEIEGLLDQVEALDDPRATELATELVSALLELHGEGLRRVMAIGERAGEDVTGALAEDELISQLLLLHGLHPIPVETRVREALDGVRPYLESHGGDVELLAIKEGIARLRLEGSCSGCPSSAMTLKLAIEEAIAKQAPEIESVEADGVAAEPAPAPLLQIENAGPAANGGGAAEERPWTSVEALPDGAAERATLREVSAEPVLFVTVDGTPYAYRPACPACGSSLEDALLERGELECPGCGKHFDARRAGRCLDAPDLHLEPIPLLAEEGGGVKLALGAGVAA